MKRKHISSLFLLILSLSIVCSCRSTNYLTMNAVEPAPVYVPSGIQHVGVINRSLPSANKKLDDLDKILSLEGKEMDKEAADAAVMGLAHELSKNQRFSEIKVIDASDVKSPGMGIFPAPLSWEKVQSICKEQQVDLLFVLSFYDTDAALRYEAIPIEINGPLGVKIPAIEHLATLNTLIKTGWRIYDPIGKNILDEYLINENLVLSGRGINPVKAAEAIIGRKEAVVDISGRIGKTYALRIIPYTIRVRRNYYVRGTNNFKIAKRRAQTGNWDGAAELWKMETSNSKNKVAGRATYNMAIINEINGDLDAAIEWASKSYTDYRNKLALEYLRILKNRRAKNRQLEQENN